MLHKRAANMHIDALVERVKAILIEPNAEWLTIADEHITPPDLYRNYVAILAAIPAVFGFVKGSFIGIDVPMIGTMRTHAGAGLAAMFVDYALTLAKVYLIALAVNALAPTFGGRKDPLQALKLTAYAYTASWVAGFGLIVPWLGMPIAIAGIAYSIYLFYLGLPVLTKCPREQTGSFTLVTIVVAAVLSLVHSHVVGTITAGESPNRIDRTDIDYTKDSTIGALDDRSHAIDAAMKQAEAARRAGESAPPTEH